MSPEDISSGPWHVQLVDYPGDGIPPTLIVTQQDDPRQLICTIGQTDGITTADRANAVVIARAGRMYAAIRQAAADLAIMAQYAANSDRGHLGKAMLKVAATLNTVAPDPLPPL